MIIKLDNNYSLTTEPHLKGVRFIVLQNGSEFVCRKESFRKLNNFLAIDENRIFKGRLQLYNHQDNIAVEVKGIGLAQSR